MKTKTEIVQDAGNTIHEIQFLLSQLSIKIMSKEITALDEISIHQPYANSITTFQFGCVSHLTACINKVNDLNREFEKSIV